MEIKLYLKLRLAKSWALNNNIAQKQWKKISKVKNNDVPNLQFKVYNGYKSFGQLQ